MKRSNEVVLYAVSAILLAGAASLWWQGVRPSPPRQASTVTPIPGDAADPAGAPSTAPSNDASDGASQAGSDPASAILVHVAGAVKTPGVYGLKDGQRLYEAIALAVPEEDADLDALNLASPLRDAQKVYVPRKGESKPQYPPQAAEPGPSQPAVPAIVFPIDINSATQRELEELPGIGPVLAAAIVDRRNQFGPFERPEDLKTVSGIGEKTYARIAALVTVK